MYVREVYGVLGRSVRVQLPECMERFIKSSFFPNEDGTDYVGFAEADDNRYFNTMMSNHSLLAFYTSLANFFGGKILDHKIMARLAFYLFVPNNNTYDKTAR